MEIKIIEEAGHETAIQGMRFSHQTECSLTECIAKDYGNTLKIAETLASKDKGHNKFLESIMVWFDMRAPLYFWKQFDTYRVGVTKQSKSTMHSIMKRNLTVEDFTGYIYKMTIANLNYAREQGNFQEIIENLPDGYLQTRRICCSYKTIRHILQQRGHHKLGEWAEFCNFMKKKLKYPRLLGADIV